jgi:hypothetical protein
VGNKFSASEADRFISVRLISFLAEVIQMNKPFKDDKEVKELVRAFEGCTIHPAEFKHYQHLAIALWYVANFSYDEATVKVRTGIQKLAAAYGKSGYHETITLFWLAIVREFCARSHSHSIADLANNLAFECADKNLIRNHYSEELLTSDRAKHGWVAPDLKPLADLAEV